MNAMLSGFELYPRWVPQIFDMVFRYLPIFRTVLRYWVPPNVPLNIKH